jgi:hypothetical protein
MMIIKKMKSLTILLLIITIGVLYVLPVNADCGWVLWLKTETWSYEKSVFPKVTTGWEISAAVPQFEQCLKMRQETWKRRKSFWSDSAMTGVKKVDGREDDLLFIYIGNDKNDSYQSITETLICIPSTLDPRERK